MTPARLEIIALEDFPLVEPGDDIAQRLIDRAPNGGYRDGDILIIAQKIIFLEPIWASVVEHCFEIFFSIFVC